ncbi:hypothetical protein BJX62DRAFT_228508 [Aspergillus germanicus]
MQRAAPGRYAAHENHPESEVVLPHWSVFFLYIGALKSPDSLRDGMDRYEDENEDGRFINLYEFGQITLKASFIKDYNNSSTVTSRKWSWMPLERATTAFKVDLTPINLPWHYAATFLNQDILPPFLFARKFLEAISNCKVRLRYIAPGIRFPTRPGDCPLRIFQIDDAEQQPIAHDQRFRLRNIAAGLYIHPVVQHWPLFWSNRCRLLLPFGIAEPFGLEWYISDMVKPRDTHADLYQGGTINGITNFHLVQVDKVLNNWADRIERGDWEVDKDGVAGEIDKLERRIQRRISKSIGFQRRGERCI